MKKANSKMTYIGTARDGNSQRFNAYVRRATGKFVTRFFVDNYPKGHRQWNGKGCNSFTKLEDAVAFGYKIASAARLAEDWYAIKEVVELDHAHKRTFS